jgi:cytochrome b
MPEPALAPVRVWDLPTRLFHWLLLAAVVGAVVTANIGGNAMVWHVRLGCAILGLLVFRLLWGLVGGHWSRFSRFLWGPGALLRYLRGQARPEDRFDVGHSPLGSLSVWAMLLVLLAQVGTGLFADDEVFTTGPLNRFVETATGLKATAWHTGPGKLLLLALVVLHVAAIVYYARRRGRNLVRPMIVGDKPLPPGTPASADSAPQRLLALVLAAASAGVAVFVASLGLA